MSTTTLRPAGAPERIDRILTHEILRGVHPPGAQLPPLRTLAETHGVNPSTMQRALARLESRGLVTARQGSGFTVNDPSDVGDLSLVADWLAVTADDPERSALILADLLEARRVLGARLIARHRLAVLDATAEVLARAAGLLDRPPGEVWEADLDVARTVITATGNTVALVILNALGRALSELPVLVAAMYDDLSRNVGSMVEVMAAVADGGPDLATRVEEAIAGVDAHTVATYRRLLGAGGAS